MFVFFGRRLGSRENVLEVVNGFYVSLIRDRGRVLFRILRCNRVRGWEFYYSRFVYGFKGRGFYMVGSDSFRG